MKSINKNNLRVGMGALTDNFYVGELNDSNEHFVWKKDVTNDVLDSVIKRFCGYEETLQDNKGNKYKIKVVKIEED